jgi:hypothetical protein
MARKNVIKGYKPFDEVDISSNQDSEEIVVTNLDKASIHVMWSGSSPVGTMVVQAKNGEKGTYYNLEGLDAISITGNSGDHVIIFSDMPFTHLKISFTNTSGTGSMTANMTAKQIGG